MEELSQLQGLQGHQELDLPDRPTQSPDPVRSQQGGLLLGHLASHDLLLHTLSHAEANEVDQEDLAQLVCGWLEFALRIHKTEIVLQPLRCMELHPG